MLQPFPSHVEPPVMLNAARVERWHCQWCTDLSYSTLAHRLLEMALPLVERQLSCQSSDVVKEAIHLLAALKNVGALIHGSWSSTAEEFHKSLPTHKFADSYAQRTHGATQAPRQTQPRDSQTHSHVIRATTQP